MAARPCAPDCRPRAERAGAPEQGSEAPRRRGGHLSEDSITRLIGAVLMEANDEWQLQQRYMQIEGMAELAAPLAEEQPLLTPKAA
jgi:hypothetical protein